MNANIEEQAKQTVLLRSLLRGWHRQPLNLTRRPRSLDVAHENASIKNGFGDNPSG